MTKEELIADIDKKTGLAPSEKYLLKSWVQSLDTGYTEDEIRAAVFAARGSYPSPHEQADAVLAELKRPAQPYPIGMILEFSDEETQVMGRLARYLKGRTRPYMDDKGFWWKHARVPFIWKLAPSARYVAVFDTGATDATSSMIWNVGGYSPSYGTCIHIEERPDD